MKIAYAVFLTISYYILANVISLWLLFFEDPFRNYILMNSYHLIDTVLLFILVLLFLKLTKQSSALEFKKTDPKYYLIAVLSGIAFVFFQYVLNILYYLNLEHSTFDFSFRPERLLSLNILATILLVPVMEEIFFRNLLLNGLLKFYSPFKSIAISSILFAFIHIYFVLLIFDFESFNLHQAYIVLFGGFISGWMYYKSKSIIPSILFHIFWNFTSNVM